MGVGPAVAAPVAEPGSPPDSLTFELIPEWSEFPAGAPVLATLLVLNRGDETTIDFGRNGEGYIGLQILNPEGGSVDARMPNESGISFSGLRTLKKNEVCQQTLILNEWSDSFEETGEYSVTAYVGEDLARAGDRRATASVRIIPFDPARMKEICAKLEARALQADAEISIKAARALSFVSQKECLPHLGRVLNNSFHSKMAAARALARIGTEEAIQKLAEGWDGLLAGERGGVLSSMDETQRQALASALALEGKRLMPEDPWN